MIPLTVDWDGAFRLAVLALLNGQDPLVYIWNPPWVLFPLIPFALLPTELGRPLMAMCGATSFLCAGRKLGASLLAQLAFLFSPLILTGLFWGNVEWLVMLGIITTPWVGMLLCTVKPQAASGIALWIAGKLAWHHQVNALAKIAIATGMLFALSIIQFGAWWERSTTYLTFGNHASNTSLFPFSIILGLGMLIASVWKGRAELAIAASPCFFPVVTPQVWGLFSFSLIRSTPKMVIGSLAMWMIVLFYS